MALTWTERSNERGDRWLECGLWRINRVPMPDGSARYEVCRWQHQGSLPDLESAKRFCEERG